jgi:hypothetical protein
MEGGVEIARWHSGGGGAGGVADGGIWPHWSAYSFAPHFLAHWAPGTHPAQVSVSDKHAQPPAPFSPVVQPQRAKFAASAHSTAA